MGKFRGLQSIEFTSRPSVVGFDAIVGKKESEGPLGKHFSHVVYDELYGEKSFEYAERKFYKSAVELTCKKAGLKPDDIRILLGGDLLNQIISAGYAARDLKIPFLGLYGACSTMAQSLLLGGVLIDGGYADKVACAVSSHFASAERQYRFPLELGNQRTPTAQWTITGAGCTILSDEDDSELCLTGATVGRVTDYGICDANNMGAAMAPAAADTILRHLHDFNRCVEDYDLIVTGDLGFIGLNLLKKILSEAGIEADSRFNDCGCMIFDPKTQDVHAGGSGCGCSAVVLNGYLLDAMRKGKYERILFCATGAKLSTTSSQQGESIPGIAHAVVIERRK